MALVLEWDGHATLLCGCCHAGLLNTLAHAVRLLGRPIEVVAGGLHLTSAGKGELDHICGVLGEEPALQRIYPNHCTGEAAFVALTNAFGASVVRPCPAGTTLDLSV
jgi:7,8-dihydropterin-6-yl-methyl-4-(beta-D-ribofuranosyl)aminobenzene 5'-phosphate synthase